MNLRKKCTKVTSLILAVAVGLLLTGAIFHQTFCTEGAPTLTSLGGDAVENQEPPIEEIKREKKKIKKRRAYRRNNIRSQQSKIKERLIKIDRISDCRSLSSLFSSKSRVGSWRINKSYHRNLKSVS